MKWHFVELSTLRKRDCSSNARLRCAGPRSVWEMFRWRRRASQLVGASFFGLSAVRRSSRALAIPRRRRSWPKGSPRYRTCIRCTPSPWSIHANSRLTPNDQPHHAFAVAYSSVILNFSAVSSSAAVRINHSAAHRCFQNDDVCNLRWRDFQDIAIKY